MEYLYNFQTFYVIGSIYKYGNKFKKMCYV